MRIKIFLVATLSLALSGCGITGSKSSFMANRYFSNQEYQKGVSLFTKEVQNNPGSALDNYFLGRFYLAQNKAPDAIPYLKKAVSLDSENSDYQFWLGVAAGAAGDQHEERKRYEKTLEINSSHPKARMYLAHLELKEGRYNQALKLYDKLLTDYPYNAAALYNRALCLNLTSQHREEKEAWLNYLKYYPAGFLASRAADHLNKLGDFSYRNHQFGYRTVTLREINFSDADLSLNSRQSMRLAGAVLSNFETGDLQITVFVAGKRELARERAKSLRRFLMQEYPQLDSSRIKLSWFAEPETLYGNGKNYRLKESVRIYMTNWRPGLFSS